MRVNRLFQIVNTIINRGTITAIELAEKFEVSTRTIYRDIDELSAAGIPIYTVKGNGGGIALLDEYVMNKAYVSKQESESLLPALKALQATNYPEKFAEEVLYQLYDYYDESNLIRNEDGSYTVHVTFPENEWIYSYVLSFGSDVEVIEPLYVRKEMIRRLSKNIEKYR